MGKLLECTFWSKTFAPDRAATPFPLFDLSFCVTMGIESVVSGVVPFLAVGGLDIADVAITIRTKGLWILVEWFGNAIVSWMREIR